MKRFWQRKYFAFVTGAVIGLLGGLIGLGGAEFRLPVLVGMFGFATLEAVIINKLMSLVVVTSAIPFRSVSIPWGQVAIHWPVILNILAGSLVGACIGAHYATRLKVEWLNRIIMVLLVMLAVGMLLGHTMLVTSVGEFSLIPIRMLFGVICGVGIGLVAALLGVAGGELIIPTLVLLYGIDIKLAGSLSLCISLPTMLVAFTRYSQSGAFAVVRRERYFLTWMTLGSLVGTALGGLLLGIMPTDALILLLGLVLLISAVKVFKH
ncbi:MAG: sulfite exporter TauE/SafE family protein [Methylotenera sp.]|nr:sulfite exporter TauE/SafE family protein [Methylotenera sp.]MDZ4211791.1 sulfite exporter TauE/SafE family protein [Methylotenera sp.]